MGRRRRKSTPNQEYIIAYIGLAGTACFFAGLAVIFFYDRDPVPVLAQIGSITIAVITGLSALYPVVGDIERNGVKPNLPPRYDDPEEE